MKKIRAHKGFTLLEMLIVVAIIAILAAIALPIYHAQLEKVRETADVASEKTLQSIAAIASVTREITADGEVKSVDNLEAIDSYFYLLQTDGSLKEYNGVNKKDAWETAYQGQSKKYLGKRLTLVIRPDGTGPNTVSVIWW